MANLVINRWRKGPHDRLYVKTRGGIEVGWFDIRTQRQHLQIPGMYPEFQAAVARWREAHPGAAFERRPAAPAGTAAGRGAGGAGVRVPRPRGRASSSRAGGGDLADRRPGESLSARAEALRPRNPLVRVLARLLRVRTRDRAWRIGAQGERHVGRKLDRLRRRGWYVLHGVDLGGRGDIDHLMIGPYGVFTVNTKHHPRAMVTVGRSVVFVRRREQPYVGKAHREAARVRAALTATLGRPVNVAPLIVVHGHARLSGWLRRRPHGVQVLPSWAVRWWFRLPGRAVLSPGDVEAVYAVARRSGTWATA